MNYDSKIFGGIDKIIEINSLSNLAETYRGRANIRPVGSLSDFDVKSINHKIRSAQDKLKILDWQTAILKGAIAKATDETQEPVKFKKKLTNTIKDVAGERFEAIGKAQDSLALIQAQKNVLQDNITKMHAEIAKKTTQKNI